MPAMPTLYILVLCCVQTVRVHSGTVDSYLEEVILASVESTADQEARKEVRRQADTINTIAHQFVHT